MVGQGSTTAAVWFVPLKDLQMTKEGGVDWDFQKFCGFGQC